MDIIEYLNKCRLKTSDIDFFDDETTQKYAKKIRTLKEEIIDLIYEPYKEKIVGTDGLAEGAYNISVGDPDLIYKDVINIYADINSFVFDELIFKLDDPALYKEILTDLFCYFNVHQSEEINFNSIMTAISNSLDQIFGYGAKTSERLTIYHAKEKFVSIRDFYNKDAAVCIERTAVAHNVLKMLNVECSMLPVVIFDGKSNFSHVLNVVENNDSIYFVDFTITSMYRIPNINVLTKEEYNEFLLGNHQLSFECDDANYTIKPYNIYKINTSLNTNTVKK